MNLTQLKYFRAVCELHTVSNAAEHLYISQPSLSNSIKELEKEFGIALFQRHHKGMKLTPAGEMLYKMSKDLLVRFEQIELVMKDMGEGRKILRLGVPPMIGAMILPHIFKNFQSEHPSVHLEITEGGRRELKNKLNEGFLDMVFLPHNNPIENDLNHMHIAQLEIVCCVSKENFLSQNCSVTPKDLENVPVVLFENSFFQTEEIKKWFLKHKIEPYILFQTEQLSTVESLISNNTAVGFLFRQLIEHNADFVSVPVSDSMCVDVSLVWKKDAFCFNTMSLFCDYIKKSNPFNMYD